MMEQNPPVDRFKYVVKQYWDTPHRRILYDVGQISLSLTGRDHAAYDLNRTYHALQNHLDFPETGGEYQLLFDRAQREYALELIDEGYATDVAQELMEEEFGTYEAWLDKNVERDMNGLLRHVEKELPPRHPHDFLIPWIARELGRLNKEVRKGRATNHDYTSATNLLGTKGPAIGMWVEQERIDLGKVSLAEAVEAVKDFEVERAGGLPQGEEVYRFKDGWTVQMLSADQLDAEGEEMQHCVAGYCDQVRHGETFIFSLRNPSGRPHVTIEWEPKSRLSDAEVDALKDFLVGYVTDVETPGRFVQIMGKQNDEPADKYRPYVQEFINQRFGGDLWGIAQVLLPGQTISLKGKSIEGGAWYYLPDSALSQVDFEGATFRDVRFTENLNDVDFFKVLFVGCEFSDMELRDCSFSGSDFWACEFDGVVFQECSFDGAVFRSAWLDHRPGVSSLAPEDAPSSPQRWDADWAPDLKHVTFARCDLRASRWYALDTIGVHFDDCQLDDAYFEGIQFERWSISAGSLDALTFRGRNEAELKLMNVDLSDEDSVSENTVRTLCEMTQGPHSEAKGVTWPDGFDHHACAYEEH
jgi:uncharacterized protein YjbI with pentapeptide repeats